MRVVLMVAKLVVYLVACSVGVMVERKVELMAD